MIERTLIFALAAFLTAAVTICAAELPDDTAAGMKVKSRKLVFKADPKGLDWAARGSLTKTKTGRWIATYTQATQHGAIAPRNVVIHTSDDEGRTWSKPNCLPDGTTVQGAPLRAEHERIEPNDGGVLTCPNGDLLYISMNWEHIKGKKKPEKELTRQWRSTDNGASWKYEGPSPGIPAGVTYAHGKTVEGRSIYITALTDPSPPWAVVYRSDDNAHTWQKVSEYATREDDINETGIVFVDEATIMVVGRSFDEDVTKMRISRDRGKTWGPMTDITKYVHVVQQPKLTKFPKEPGRNLPNRSRSDSGVQTAQLPVVHRRLWQDLEDEAGRRRLL
ncbi:MAG: sialidase family protein [candidate division KSB1 bacterium]|nr:sialidase family protein [candidate division KSB1 bacterium]